MTMRRFLLAIALLLAGSGVVWADGIPQVVSSTTNAVLNATADSIYIAGVVAEGMTCPDQSLCEIVVHGPTRTICADASDAVTEDQMVAGSATSGQCGDYGPAANTCALGILLEDDGTSSDSESEIVFVNISCQ